VARTQAQSAIESAPGENDVVPLVEAILGQAETALRAENLEAAVANYNRVQQLAQASELADEQAVASLGLARVLLRRGLLQEAIDAHTETLPRLRTTEDVAAQALAYLGLAEGYRLNGDRDLAQDALAEAHRIYSEMGDILGEAEATQSESRLLLDHGDLEKAGLRTAYALDLVERVGEGLKDAALRSSFFDGYAAFYSEGMLVAARAQQVETANQLALRYKRLSTKVGRAAAVQRLSEYEQAITVRGAGLSKEDIERNRATAALLSSVRKTLSK
jgi:tetratricopeptide (TPR) repeat protein